MKTISASDWVALRLARLAGRSNPRITLSPEYMKSVMFLVNRYGSRAIVSAIEQLDTENSNELRY